MTRPFYLYARAIAVFPFVPTWDVLYRDMLLLLLSVVVGDWTSKKVRRLRFDLPGVGYGVAVTFRCARMELVFVGAATDVCTASLAQRKRQFQSLCVDSEVASFVPMRLRPSRLHTGRCEDVRRAALHAVPIPFSGVCEWLRRRGEDAVCWVCRGMHGV